jgi:hypothetical protein
MKRLVAFLQDLKRRRDERAAVVPLDRKCPCCGHVKAEGHRLRACMVQTSNQAAAPFVEHTCAVCGAPWYEPSVLAGEKWLEPKVSRLEPLPAPAPATPAKTPGAK